MIVSMNVATFDGRAMINVLACVYIVCLCVTLLTCWL